VALLTTTPLLVLARNALPAGDLASLIAWLKANPGKATQGTSGVGSISHAAGILFQKATGTHFAFVPYRGAAPIMQDLGGVSPEFWFKNQCRASSCNLR
jgi:tripartite-type tricarboxylate transporter receptor subunit TctC